MLLNVGCFTELLLSEQIELMTYANEHQSV